MNIKKNPLRKVQNKPSMYFCDLLHFVYTYFSCKKHNIHSIILLLFRMNKKYLIVVPFLVKHLSFLHMQIKPHFYRKIRLRYKIISIEVIYWCLELFDIMLFWITVELWIVKVMHIVSLVEGFSICSYQINSDLICIRVILI